MQLYPPVPPPDSSAVAATAVAAAVCEVVYYNFILRTTSYIQIRSFLLSARMLRRLYAQTYRWYLESRCGAMMVRRRNQAGLDCATAVAISFVPSSPFEIGVHVCQPQQ